MKNTIKLTPNPLDRKVIAGIIAAGASLLVSPLVIAQEDSDEDIFELSPFTVEGTEDTGYRATSTLAGTRIRTDLKDVGSAISVMTESFLNDTASNNSEDLLTYATSTEVAGQGGNFVGAGAGTFLDTTHRNSPVSNTRVRGLDEADNTRNFYLSDIPWDSYNVNRVDLQRGPNSILFGIGSPAGIINAGLESASFEDENEVSVEFGRFGSVRYSGNFNKVILEDELAVRIALLQDEKNYRQDPAFRDDSRIYAALTWKPTFLSGENWNTEISTNYEKGHIDSNNPRLTPPIDAISPWFGEMNQQTYRAPVVNSSDSADWFLADGVTPNGYGGATQSSSPNYSPWIGPAANRIYDGIAVQFTPDGAQGLATPADVREYGNGSGTRGSGGGSYRGVTTYNSYASNYRSNFDSEAFPGVDISAYKARSLTDRSIFDFYNNLIEGENKSEFQDFDAYNLVFRQSFFGNKLAYELAWDKQDSNWGRRNFLSGDGSSLTVDMMSHLVDGTPNPNVGRPMVVAGGSGDLYEQFRERDVKRATVFGELDFTNNDNDLLASILGRHNFTGLYSENEFDSQTYQGKRNFIDRSFVPNSTGAVNQAQRDAHVLSYLGDSLIGRSVSEGLNIPRVMSVQNPVSTTISVWNNTPVAGFDPGSATDDELDDPANYIGWESLQLPIVNAWAMPFDQRPYTNGSSIDNKIESEAFVWHGYFFDGNVVPMIGWRRDTDTARSAGSPAADGGIVDVFNPEYRLPNGPDDSEDVAGRRRSYNTETGESLTKSIVVHTPQSWRDAMGGVGISLHYNESENFRPDAGRIDVLGNTVPSPNGETEEYGFSVSAFNDRLVAKANWYETTVYNANAGEAIGGNYLIGAVEAWGQQYAIEARDRTGAFATVYGTSSSGGDVVYRPAGDPDSEGDYSQAQLDEAYAVQEAAISAWLSNPVSQQFQQTWALTNYDTKGGETNFGPPGLVTTSDTFSEGFEFELVANPIDGLSVSFNAAQMKAQRANLAAGYVEWVESRYADFQNTPQGDIRLWGPNDDGSFSDQGGETTEGKYMRETIAGLNFWRALEGGDVPEVVEWRYNTVVNYAFQDGRFSGLNIGGSMRYQEAPTVGFPVIQGANGPVYDVTDPIKGKAEEVWDFWAGYEMPLGDRVNWRIQLNVRNLFGDSDLYPVTVQPDGSLGTVRIGAPMTWTLRNTFTF